MTVKLKTSDLKKALAIFKKLDKSLLNRDRIVSIHAEEGENLVMSYRTGFEEIVWTPHIYAGSYGLFFDVAMEDLEKTLSGSTVELSGTGGILRVNGIPVPPREAPLKQPGFEVIGDGAKFDAIAQKYYLRCAAAASTKKAEEAVKGIRPRYCLTYVEWNERGMSGTNGKILIHEDCAGILGDPIYIPNNAVVKAMIAEAKGVTMEIGEMIVPPEEKEFAERAKLMIKSDHFTYWQRRETFSYPDVRQVMTYNRTDAKMIEFLDAETPLIPALSFKYGGDNHLCITREDDGKVYLSNNAGKTEIKAEAEKDFPGSNIRQDILKIALGTGIRKFYRMNDSVQYWGVSPDEGTYVTFMGAHPFTNPQAKPDETEESASA